MTCAQKPTARPGATRPSHPHCAQPAHAASPSPWAGAAAAVHGPARPGPARALLCARRVVGPVSGWHWARVAAGCGRHAGPVPGLCPVSPELASASDVARGLSRAHAHGGGGHVSAPSPWRSELTREDLLWLHTMFVLTPILKSGHTYHFYKKH